ncbi:MAG: hypothetical protein J0L92_10070 [Deltaproteobacteria bacterium]|nr:hypothetical protein [Deltaproteobacteria bacterium]
MKRRTAWMLGALALPLTGCPSASNDDAAIEGDAGMDAPEPIDAAVPADAYVPPVPSLTIDAANAVPDGDPLFEGQQRFLWDTWGTERLDAWPPADWMLALMTREPEVFGDQYASFGFTPDPDDDFPVGLKRGIDDATRVHETCALCHVGELPDGRLWLGAPNRELDMSAFRAAVSERWVADGHAPLLSDSEAAKASAYGPGRTGAESSSYPVPVPADFPPYWLLGDRTHTNYLGTGGNVRTEVYLGLFTFGAGAPDARTAVVPFPTDERLDPFLSFMGAMASPSAPPGDATAIAAGQGIFERERCSECHHVDDIAANGVTTYDRSVGGLERFPGDDAMFPRGSIRTSYMHRTLIDGEPDAGIPIEDAGLGEDWDGGLATDPGFADLLRFISTHRLSVAPSDGYRVSDLRGLWATAPYLHNGSVPTLEDLLRPAAERPATFMRGEFLVDTATAGNSNVGHEFGTTISDDDRAALVAYLLSL